MKFRKIAWLVFGVCCAAIYCFSAMSINSGEEFSVAVELARPMSIVWPMEVAIAGDAGEKALRIGPKVGRGWKGEAGGQAEYKFYIPKAGKYYVWFYSLWFDECSNTVFVRIDNNEKIILGNDPVYNQWHWGRGFDVYLEQGTHRMMVSNHSDHVAIQKILFINSQTTRPGDSSVVFSDIFYEGFDGCDQGNFSQWDEFTGQWMVTNPVDQMNFSENVLLGNANNGKAFILYKPNPWADYSLNLKLKADLSGASGKGIAVCFGAKDKDRYYKLQFEKAKADGKALAMIIYKDGSDEKIIESFEVNWHDDKWGRLEISLLEGCIGINFGDKAKTKVKWDKEIRGTVGFELKGETVGFFDDIHVRAVEKPEQD